MDEASLAELTNRLKPELHSQYIFPKDEWLQACAIFLVQTEAGFQDLPLTRQVEICFAHFLLSDMNVSGHGSLPANVNNMHKQELTGAFVLQVDEAVDIATPAKDRYNESGNEPPSRFLKLSLTDGVQRVTAIEYRRIEAFRVHMPAGTKVALHDTPVRRGLLLLSPENLDFLGGHVAALEEARQRIVKRWNQPSRGWRARARGGVGGGGGRGRDSSRPSLQEEAMAVAWRIEPSTGSVVEQSSALRGRPQEIRSAPDQSRSSVPANLGRSETSGTRMETESTQGGAGSTFRPTVVSRPETDFSQRNQPNGQENRHPEVVGNGRISSPPIVNEPSMYDREGPGTGASTGARMGEGPGLEDLPMDDEADMEILMEMEANSMRQQTRDNTGHRRLSVSGPFAYLAGLMGSNNARSPGFTGRNRVKCLFTAVKEFQVETFGLIVVVEDGSFMLDARVDQPVIEQILGLSAEEAMAALQQPGTSEENRVKEALKKMEVFLEEFEGVVELEWDCIEEVPLITAIAKGCEIIDAERLLEVVSSRA